MRCLIPRANSRELVTDKILELMYLISQGYEIDVPSVVMDHMYYCSAKNRNHSLPYANLLTLFFKFYEVPLEK